MTKKELETLARLQAKAKAEKKIGTMMTNENKTFFKKYLRVVYGLSLADIEKAARQKRIEKAQEKEVAEPQEENNISAMASAYLPDDVQI